MATRKKLQSKKKVGAKSKQPIPKFSKLDPTLFLGALHASKEHRVKRKRVSKKTLAKLPLSRRVRIGVHSLTANLPPVAVKHFRRTDLVPVLIETTKSTDLLKRIERWEGECVEVSSSKICARVPRTRIIALSKLAGIKYIEAGVRLRPHCELAHRSTNLLPATGLTRTVSETGQGVLVGIVDTGIDVTHPAFQVAGQTRIVNYMDQERGREFSASQIDAGDASGSPDIIGHGTHVAGIASGNGRGSPNSRWAGVAPNADLAVVKTSFLSSDIALAIHHIFTLADSRNQPCVVNLSLGGHVGGHDGTTITERTIDELSGAGRLVVISAGNEGGDHIHASTVLQRGSGDRWVADFDVKSQVFDTDSGPQELGYVVLQVWHQSEDQVSIQLRSPNGQLLIPPVNNQSEVDQGVFFLEMSHQQHPYSGDHVTTFTIITEPKSQWLGGWSLIAEHSGNIEVGSVHAWINDFSQGEFSQGANDGYLVGMPGTAFSAITVASYATRNQWPSRVPNQPDGTVLLDAMNLEDISYFSSPGPTRDGQNKPDVTAPGQWLLAPLSSGANLDEMPDWLRVQGRDYAALQGTSMSAPYVTGALALLLEKEPNIDWAEAKRRLIKSVSTDRHTEVCWNPRWGYGRVNLERLIAIEP